MKAHASKAIIGIGVLQVMLLGSSFALTGTALARDTYDFADRCPTPDGGRMISDNRTYYRCECTSYASKKMSEHSVPASKYTGLGGAGTWMQRAKNKGISVDKSPKHRDVAWWSGHVAYVESVDSKGNITVSEYNYNPPYGHDYGTRSLSKGASNYPQYFIHFGAK